MSLNTIYQYPIAWRFLIGIVYKDKEIEKFTKTKIGRRTAKAATRVEKAVELEIANKRPQNEVRDSLLKLSKAFDALALKHVVERMSIIVLKDRFRRQNVFK